MPQGGLASPIAPSFIERARQGVRYIISGVTPSTWFGPFQPLAPQAPPEVAGRQFDYPVGYNLETRPRADEPISFPQLRALADHCDLVRTVIETRKDQVARLRWSVRHRDLPDGEPRRASHDPRIAAIEDFFRMPDRANFWSSWLRQLLEDLFVIDAPALYLRRDRGGRLLALEPIDGATVKRLLNADGRTPTLPDPAYQQVLHGLPAADLTARDLIYRPRNLRAHRIYGYSPVEQIVMTINIALRRQMFQLSYYTEGNVPEALIGTPEGWGPNQIKEFQQYWDALLEGNLAQRRHAKFVPGGVAKTFIATKDVELKSDYDEWLARVICFAFSISPQPFVERMNRATAETAHATALSEGLAPIQNWIKELVDFVIVTEFGAGDLEFQWRDDSDPDPATAAGVAQTYVTNGIKAINEVRAELGLDAVPGGDQPLIITGTGAMPLTQAGAVAKVGFDPDQPPPLRKDFNSDQPRVPAGDPDGGQWTASGDDIGSAATPGDSPVQIAQADTEVRTDAGRSALPDHTAVGRYATLNNGSIVLGYDGKPMPIPPGVSLADNAKLGQQIMADYNDAVVNTPEAAGFAREGRLLALFLPGSPMDYQSVFGDNGKANPAYVDFGNYNYGVVAAAAGLSFEETEIAAGIINLRPGTRDRSGPWFNNPRDFAMFQKGYKDYNSGKTIPLPH